MESPKPSTSRPVRLPDAGRPPGRPSPRTALEPNLGEVVIRLLDFEALKNLLGSSIRFFSQPPSDKGHTISKGSTRVRQSRRGFGRAA
jgi:hypothetical protein